MTKENTVVSIDTLNAWLLTAFLLLIQWLLFKQYAYREILWGYPDFSDQSAYLSRAFALYDLILHEGLFKALKWDFFKARGTGSLLHLQGAFAFLLNGPNRFNAISLNFIYYALFQAMLLYVVYFFSHSYKLAFICLGILISSVFPFNYAGGFHDFRIDFISFCLFGIFLLSGLRSEIFINKKWAVATGAFGAYLFLFRHNTIVYLTGIYALIGIGIFLISFLQTKHILSVYQNKRFQGLLLSGFTYVVLILPFLLVNFKAILSYYLSQSIDRSAIRNSQIDLESLWNFLFFYPIQLFTKHIGLFALILSTLCMILLCVVSLYYKRKYYDASKVVANRHDSAIPYLYAHGFILTCFFVPMFVLTVNTSKSPIVGGILYPSLLTGIVMTLIYIYSEFCQQYYKFRGMRFFISFMVVISLFSGILTHMVILTKPSPQSKDRERVEKIVDMHLELGRFAVQMGIKSPSILIDTIRDDLSSRIPTTLLYERDRQLVVFFDIGITGQIFSDSENKIINDLEQADFMLLREGPKLCYGFDILPYNQVMEAIRPRLRAYAEENMIFLKKWQIGNDDFTLYTAPQIRLKKGINFFGDSYGWITDEGFSIRIPADFLKRKPLLRLNGNIHTEPFQGKLPTPNAKILCGDKLQKTVPSGLFVQGNKYVLSIDVSEFGISDYHGNCEIKVIFDSYFIPAALDINTDTRKLVIQTPEKIKITTVPTPTIKKAE